MCRFVFVSDWILEAVSGSRASNSASASNWPQRKSPLPLSPHAGRAPRNLWLPHVQLPQSLWKFSVDLNLCHDCWLLGSVCGRRLVWGYCQHIAFHFSLSSRDVIMQPVWGQVGSVPSGWPNTVSHSKLRVMNHNIRIAVLAFCLLAGGCPISNAKNTLEIVCNLLGPNVPVAVWSSS